MSCNDKKQQSQSSGIGETRDNPIYVRAIDQDRHGGLGESPCLWCNSDLNEGHYKLILCPKIILKNEGGLGFPNRIVDSLNKYSNYTLTDYSPFINGRLCSFKCYNELKNQYFKTMQDTFFIENRVYYLYLKKKKLSK